MHTKKIHEQLDRLTLELRTIISELPQKTVEEKTGLLQPDISAWKNGQRKWSYEKILNVYERLSK